MIELWSSALSWIRSNPVKVGLLANSLFALAAVLWLISDSDLVSSFDLLAETDLNLLLIVVFLQLFALVLAPSLMLLLWVPSQKALSFFRFLGLNLQLRVSSAVMNSSAIAVYRGFLVSKFIGKAKAFQYTMVERFSATASLILVSVIVAITIFPGLLTAAELPLVQQDVFWPAVIVIVVIAFVVVLLLRFALRTEKFKELIATYRAAVDKVDILKISVGLLNAFGQVGAFFLTGYLLGISVGLEEPVQAGLLRIVSGLLSGFLAFLPSTGAREFTFMGLAIFLEIGTRAQLNSLLMLYVGIVFLMLILGLAAMLIQSIILIKTRSTGTQKHS